MALKGIQDYPSRIKPLTRDRALEIFTILSGMGYGCAVKHLRGNYYVEVPVRLRGDKAYHEEALIMQVARRGGYEVLQTGSFLESHDGQEEETSEIQAKSPCQEEALAKSRVGMRWNRLIVLLNFSGRHCQDEGRKDQGWCSVKAVG